MSRTVCTLAERITPNTRRPGFGEFSPCCRARAAGSCLRDDQPGLLVPAPGCRGRSRPQKTAALARYFPRQDLVVYAEFDGFDTHADLWQKTAAYRAAERDPHRLDAR